MRVKSSRNHRFNSLQQFSVSSLMPRLKKNGTKGSPSWFMVYIFYFYLLSKYHKFRGDPLMGKGLVHEGSIIHIYFNKTLLLTKLTKIWLWLGLYLESILCLILLVKLRWLVLGYGTILASMCSFSMSFKLPFQCIHIITLLSVKVFDFIMSSFCMRFR